MSKYNLQDTDYQLFFPENLKKYKNLKSLSLELEEQLKKEIISELPKLAIFKNLELQPDEVLSELAYQYMIDNWQENLDREVKIKLIKNAYWSHSKKGTKKIIEDNLKKLGYPITVEEWFEYGGRPYTFKVTINHVNSDPDWIDKLLEIIDKYKNCRSIIDTTDIEINRPTQNFKLASFKTQEIEKEFIGVHKDIEKNNTFYIKNYRVMEVTKNV